MFQRFGKKKAVKSEYSSIIIMVNMTGRIVRLKMSRRNTPNDWDRLCKCVFSFSCSPPVCVSGSECVHHSDVYQGRVLEVTVKSTDLLKSSIKNTSLPLFLFLTFLPITLPTRPHPFQTSFLFPHHLSLIHNSNDVLTSVIKNIPFISAKLHLSSE